MRSNVIDEKLRAILHESGWTFDKPPKALLALGQAGLARLLDPHTDFFPDYMDFRDYGMLKAHAIGAFAKADMRKVLAAMRKRKWSEARIAYSGVGFVQDARVVPILVRVAKDAEPLTRREAIRYLGYQRHPAATEAVLEALRDRSSDVRVEAIRALGEIGDAATEEALHEARERDSRSRYATDEVDRAIAKIRRANRLG